jgi:hypothetical protein
LKKFLSKIKSIYIYILFIAIAALVSQSSVLRSNEYITKFVNDEYHTVRLVSNSFFKSIEDSRVMGGERFFLRITYPLPIYYMTMRMGGDVYLNEGWNYPGHKYIIKNNPHEDSLKIDPNLQDYLYAYRMIQYVFFVACILFATYAMWNVISPASSIAYITLILGSLSIFNSPIIERESLYVYPDIFLGGLASLLFGLCLSYKKSVRLDYLILLLSILACSVKLNGIIIGLPFILFVILNKNIKILNIIKFCSFFTILFNAYELKYIDNFFHYQFSNLWHYNTGDGGPDLSGFIQLKKGLSELGYIAYIVPICILMHLYLFKYKNLCKNISLMLLATLLIGISYELILSKQRLFIARNYLQIYIIYSLYISTIIGIFIKDYINIIYIKYFSFIFLFLLFFYNNKYLSDTYYLNSTLKMSERCSSLGAVSPIRVEGYTQVDGVPKTYSLSDVSPIILSKLEGYECLIVKWDQDNKQLTNFYLPKTHKLIARNGDFFLYSK